MQEKNHYYLMVGRIRYDLNKKNVINLFISEDQLLKGAALNAFQIMEYIKYNN